MKVSLQHPKSAPIVIEFGKDVPEKKWRPYLHVVWMQPHRLVGLVTPLSLKRVSEGLPINIHKAVSWMSQVGFAMDPQTRQIQTQSVRGLVPYDNMDVIDTLLTQANAICHVDDLGEKIQKWLVKSYLDMIDPSNLTLATRLPDSLPKL